MDDWLVCWTDTIGNIVNLEITSARVTVTKEAKTNAAEIVLPKSQSVASGDVIFQEGETLAIYAKAKGLIDRNSPSVSDLLGTFQILNFNINPDSQNLKLTTGDLTYNLLANLYSRDITEASNDIVGNIIQTTAENGLTQTPITTNIAALKSDGIPFPTVNFVSLWKTAYDSISELSKTEYTDDDKDYIFWLDPDGTFNWVYPSADVETLELARGDNPVLTINHSRAEAETVTMVIYDAGLDLNGDQILDFYLDPNAGTIKGAIKYQPMTELANTEKRSTTITDNAEFITLIKSRAVAQAKRIIDKVGQGLNTSIIDITGQHVNMAKLHKVKSDMKSQEELRLTRVVHTLNRNGWHTRLELEEDPETENGN